jgi:hypothetical protein
MTTEPAIPTEGAEAALPALRGAPVREDGHRNICLNDLYELAGRPENLQASQWMRHKRTIALKLALDELIVCNTHRPKKEVEESTYYSVGRGPKALTFAHPVLALEYSESLDPKLGIEVKEIFLRYRAADISLANDILDRVIEQAREDEMRVHIREEITARNRDLAGEGKKAGCRGWEYAELHNAGYRGLYNGLDQDDIHHLKRLTKSQKILDHMTAAEGAANLFRITQAKLAMQAKYPKTPHQAFSIAHSAGVETREAMKKIGGVMPEKMPVAEGIGEAKKRLKTNKPLLEKD